MTIRLRLPYPISSNRYWRAVSMGPRLAMVPTKEAKAYKEDVGWRARAAGVTRPLTGRVAIHVKLFPQQPKDHAKRAQKNPDTWDDDVRCIDLGNCEKVLSDALNGIAWEDDKQLHRITLERCEPDGEGRVELTITPFERPSIAPSLFAETGA